MTPLMALRREAGLSREELARLTGRCVRVLADIERDTHNLPFPFAERVARLLTTRLGYDVTPLHLYGWGTPTGNRGAGVGGPPRPQVRRGKGASAKS